MDLEEFRSFVLDSGIDVWTWIDLAISMASTDYENELKNRRDEIIQKLYTPTLPKCQNCDEKQSFKRKNDVDCDHDSVAILQEEEDDEQKKVVDIKNLLDDQNQVESDLIGLLQRLVDMDITFNVLKETDIGRHVTQFRKHSSGEVRRLVKILVRKWKDTVDEWVKMNSSASEEVAYQFNGDHRESFQESNQYKNINHQNGVPDANSPYNLTLQKGKVKDKSNEPENYSAKKHTQSARQQDQQEGRVIYKEQMHCIDCEHWRKSVWACERVMGLKDFDLSNSGQIAAAIKGVGAL